MNPNMTNDIAKTMNRARIDEQNRKKADEFAQRVEADKVNGWNSFLARHSGAGAVAKHDVFVACEANYSLLERWCLEHDVFITDATLERAFQACKASEQLAVQKPGEYSRRSNTQESRVLPQLRSPSLSDTRVEWVAPWTREEILSWDARRLKAEMARGPRVVRAINKILNQ